MVKMRLAVLSDLHGNLEAVLNVWSTLHDIDRILCLGDIVGIGPHPGEVLEHILDDERVSWVMGNHDSNTRFDTELGPLKNISRRPHHDWVRKDMGDRVDLIDAPMSMSMMMGDRELVFMHRHPENCWEKVPYFERPFPEVLDDFYGDVEGDILFFGHTHVPLFVVSRDRRTYINPGSLGAENGGVSTYTVIDEEPSGVLGIGNRKVHYDLEKVRRDLKTKEVPYHRYITRHFFGDSGYTPGTVKDI